MTLEVPEKTMEVFRRIEEAEPHESVWTAVLHEKMEAAGIVSLKELHQLCRQEGLGFSYETFEKVCTGREGWLYPSFFQAVIRALGIAEDFEQLSGLAVAYATGQPRDEDMPPPRGGGERSS